MTRLVLIGALLAACGAADDRPRTLSYITDTILVPTCAVAECHSAFKQEVGDQFDTVAAARRSIVANALVVYPYDTAAPDQSYLIKTLTVGVQSRLGNGKVRMPYDAPMPDADVALIASWIAGGAEGAQCLANDAGQGCTVTNDGPAGHPLRYHVVACSPDGNAGQVVMDCAQDQACTYFGGNGQCR
ncbi:MAG: hypothetical protein E6J90_50470 [Deltaproteobacteria bacterium]|nr:MAG: hypothetical protein E6J90_50470 [Deltaproteobacteria bacterium]